MENHSYDNYLGTLPGRGDGLPTGPDGAPDAVNVLPNGQRVAAHHLTSTVQFPGNPTQTWNASHISYADGTCGGFATGVWKTVPGGDPAVPMGYWTEAELPFYHDARAHVPGGGPLVLLLPGADVPEPAVPDRGHRARPGRRPAVGPGGLPGGGDDLRRADHLTASPGSNYHNVNRASVVLKRLLGVHGLVALRRLAQLGRWLPGVTNAVRGNKSFTADLYPLGFARCVRHLRTTPQFFADAAAGTLPSVSIVDPDFGAYSEENPQDIELGESFSCAVVNAVMNGPAWESTLLLWIYDEHGGYYDHVLPPAAVAPDDVPARNWQLSDRWARALLRMHVAEIAQGRSGERRRRPGDVRAVRVPGAGGDRLPLRAAGLRAAATSSTTPRCSSSSRRSGTSRRSRSRDAAAVSPLGALDLTAPPAFLKPPRAARGQGRAVRAVVAVGRYGARRGGRRRSVRRS